MPERMRRQLSRRGRVLCPLSCAPKKVGRGGGAAGPPFGPKDRKPFPPHPIPLPRWGEGEKTRNRRTTATGWPAAGSIPLTLALPRAGGGKSESRTAWLTTRRRGIRRIALDSRFRGNDGKTERQIRWPAAESITPTLSLPPEGGGDEYPAREREKAAPARSLGPEGRQKQMDSSPSPHPSPSLGRG